MPTTRASRWIAVLRTPLGMCSALLMALVLAIAVLGPILWSTQASAVDTTALQQGPSAAHLLGTDNLGRDVLYRVLVATRLSIELAVGATALGVAVGALLGSAPSVLPRRPARLVIAVVNIAVAFPGLLLALFFEVIFGVGIKGAVLAIAVSMVPGFARLTQTLAASVAGRDFVAAARVAGVSRIRLLTRHILPNIGEQLAVNATISAGMALLVLAGLSFLGLGVQPPGYDWGRLLGEGLDRIYTVPTAAIAPGVAVVIAGLAFNLFGETVAAVVGIRTPVRRISARPAPVGRLDAPNAGSKDGVLVVDNLHVAFPHGDGWTTPVRGVSFTVHAGEAVGVVGESGSGKSLTALGASGLIENPAVVTADRLEFAGAPLLAGGTREHRRLLGTSLAMVFQDPMTSFNPTRRIGRQLAEVSEQHQGLSRSEAWQRAVDRLRSVRVPAPRQRARQHPHEFSGGMRQRAMIGMGLMGEPKLVVADEPTTALDVTVQRHVLRLLSDIRLSRGVAILLISHDISVVVQTCERILVMYAGRVVEDLPTAELFTTARHPYTRALLAAVPDMHTDRDAPLAVIPGRPPEPHQLPLGCAFAPRCSMADERCRGEDPALEQITPRHRVACWHQNAVNLVSPHATDQTATQTTGGKR